MKRQLIIMTLVLGALVLVDRHLDRRESRTRLETLRIRKVVPPEVFKDRPIAAVRLETPDGRAFFYAHRQGVWRCLSFHGAIAVTGQIQSVLRKVMDARGVVQSQVSEYSTNLASFGLGSTQRWRLAFCGAKFKFNGDADVLFAIDLGASTQGARGCYVRPADEARIWAIDEDLTEGLALPSDGGLAPWLDPRLIPMAWPGWQSGLRRIILERSGKKPLQMLRRDKAPDETGTRAGAPPWDWVVSEDGPERVADVRQAYFYSQFLLQAPFAGLLPPARRRDLGLEEPQNRIRLEAVSGETLELHLGPPTAAGSTPVFNTFSQSLYEIEPETVPLLLPEIEQMLDPSRGNPWEPKTGRGTQ